MSAVKFDALARDLSYVHLVDDEAAVYAYEESRQLFFQLVKGQAYFVRRTVFAMGDLPLSRAFDKKNPTRFHEERS